MNNMSPIHLFAHVCEKLHLSVATAHLFEIYKLSEPLAYWVQVSAVIPIITFIIWTALPITCKSLIWCLKILYKITRIIEKLPKFMSLKLVQVRVRFGKLLQKIGIYFQRTDFGE